VELFSHAFLSLRCRGVWEANFIYLMVVFLVLKSSLTFLKSTFVYRDSRNYSTAEAHSLAHIKHTSVNDEKSAHKPGVNAEHSESLVGCNPALESLRHAWVILSLLLHKTVNTPVMCMMICIEALLAKATMEHRHRVFVYYWLAQASFFYQVSLLGVIELSSPGSLYREYIMLLQGRNAFALNLTVLLRRAGISKQMSMFCPHMCLNPL